MTLKRPLYLILHNIRSHYNVGAIFRTAEAVGVEKIFLTGYTPAPVNRFKIPVKEIHKTALGAEKFVLWEKRKNLIALIKKLKKEKNYIVAVEQSKDSIEYTKLKPKFSLALIFGNEVKGLDKKILNHCDKIIEIPMHGKKESLNVSVAAGVVLYEILKK